MDRERKGEQNARAITIMLFQSVLGKEQKTRREAAKTEERARQAD